MNRYVSFLPLAAVAASCAVTSPTDSLDWAGFIAAFPGASHLQYEYVNGPTKVVGYADVPASISAGNARFERWCAVHGGRSDLAQRLASSSAAVSSFNNALGRRRLRRRPAPRTPSPKPQAPSPEIRDADDLMTVFEARSICLVRRLTLNVSFADSLRSHR
jgi:hypothetical protein